MTLDTRVFVHDTIEIGELFRECQRLVDSNEGTRWDDRDVSRYYGAGVWHIGNDLGQGLCALMSVEYRKDGADLLAEGDAKCDEYCEPGCDYPLHHHAKFAEVSFDTGYGYQDGMGGCGALHARIVARLGHWLDARGVRWSWENEFTGEIHGAHEQLEGLITGSESAQAWFRQTVLPAIAAEAVR